MSLTRMMVLTAICLPVKLRKITFGSGGKLISLSRFSCIFAKTGCQCYRQKIELSLPCIGSVVLLDYLDRCTHRTGKLPKISFVAFGVFPCSRKGSISISSIGIASVVFFRLIVDLWVSNQKQYPFSGKPCSPKSFRALHLQTLVY